jgi:hypothetical protein
MTEDYREPIDFEGIPQARYTAEDVRALFNFTDVVTDKTGTLAVVVEEDEEFEKSLSL